MAGEALSLPVCPHTRSSGVLTPRQAILAATANLAGRFHDVQGIYETSEADREQYADAADVSIVSTALVNSESSPHGCEETVQSLGEKLWGYQLGSTFSLQETVLCYLPLVIQRTAFAYFHWDDIEHLCYQLGDHGARLPVCAI